MEELQGGKEEKVNYSITLKKKRQNEKRQQMVTEKVQIVPEITEKKYSMVV